MEKVFVTPKAIYNPTWQFTHAIKVTGGSLLFMSGVVGITPDGQLPKGDIVRQSEIAYENLGKILAAAGGTLKDIVKVNIYVGDDYAKQRDALRDMRARFFTGDYPVSTLVQVAGFANPDYLFEIEAIAVIDR